MALTLTLHELNSLKDCNNNPTTQSDQGLVVRFLTPISNITTNGTIKADYSAQGRVGPVLNSMIQQLAHLVAQAEKDSFWNV